MKGIKANQRGSVSIFLLMIFIAIFFFHAVLIDFARVMVATRQTESNIQSGMRSVLSSYDVVLKELYGVYGTKEDEKQNMLTEILQLNVESTPGFFNLLDLHYDPTSVKLRFERPLGNSIVFEQQVLEEMKYKAPLDFTLNLIDKFSSVSLALGESSSTVTALKDVKDVYEERESELRSMLENQQQAYEVIQISMQEYMTTQEKIVENLPAYVSALENYSYYSNLEPENEDEEKEIKIKISEAQATIQDYRADGTAQLSQLQVYMEQHSKSINQALDHIGQAKSLNKQIEQRVSLAQNDRQEGYDVIDQAGEAYLEDAVIPYTEQVAEVKRSLDSMILSDTFFEGLAIQLQKHDALLHQIHVSVGDMKHAFQQVSAMELSSPSLEANLTQNKNKLSGHLDEYVSKAIQYLTNQEKKIDEAHKDRQKSKELEEQYEEKANQTQRDFHSLLQQIKELEGDKEELEAVRRLYHEYLEYNDGRKTELQEGGNEDDTDPEEFSKNSMLRMDTLFSSLGEMTTSLRDELYINEYTLARFNHFEPQHLASVFSMADDHVQVPSLSLQDQEVEYILYGFTDPWANIAAVFAEIFTIRFALNSADALVQCARTGHPLTILACVLATAFSQTIEDMKELIRGNDIKLTKRVPLTLSYQDFLRLLLFLHLREDQVYRIQAQIHHRTGKDLRHAYTYVGGEAEVSLRLWFLPGVMQAIKYTGIVDGNITNGRYYMTTQAYLSY